MPCKWTCHPTNHRRYDEPDGQRGYHNDRYWLYLFQNEIGPYAGDVGFDQRFERRMLSFPTNYTARLFSRTYIYPSDTCFH